MDVDVANGEGDKDRKSQAWVWMSLRLYCKGPQSGYILTCRRYLYPWDLLLLLRFLHDYKGVVCSTHLGIGSHTHQQSHIYECPSSSHVLESSHLVLTFSFGPKEPVLS